MQKLRPISPCFHSRQCLHGDGDSAQYRVAREGIVQLNGCWLGDVDKVG